LRICLSGTTNQTAQQRRSDMTDKSYFDTVFGMEEDITAVARLKGQCVSILAMVLGLSMALLLATAFITLLRALFGI